MKDKFPSAIVALLTVVGLCALAMILNISLSSCAEFNKAEADVSATAKALTGDSMAYANTLAKALQTINTDVKADQSKVDALLDSWGLTASNSNQLAEANKIVNEFLAVSGSVVSVNAALNPSHLATVVNPPTGMMKGRPELRPPYGSIKQESAYDLSLARR